jgi:hypothetical protein
MNTGMGNVILMCAMVYTIFSGIDYEFVNDGDDCVLIFEQDLLSNLPDIKGEFMRFGFYMEIETPVYELEHIQFCQAQPVLIDGKYRMIRDPRICLTKDCFSLRAEATNKHDIAAYRNAIGTCGLSLCSGCPVMQSFYNSMRSGVEHYPPPKSMDLESGMIRLSKGMRSKVTNVTESSRVSFAVAFDIFPSEQVALEHQFSNTVVPVIPAEYRELPPDLIRLYGC